jgi:DNA modification methylase
MDIKVLEQKTGKRWVFYLGDCVDIIKGIPDNSIHYSVYSPPFSSLFTYSNSERDMGNSRNDEQFWAHYKFLLAEMMRVLMPGRLVSVHCMNPPSLKQNHGYIGLRDFRGDIIRAHIEAGFVYHSEVVIWKDPVTAMQRTKAIGLLYKQLRKDSCMSRQGIPDYVCTFRKDAPNPEPVTKVSDSFPVGLWQNYASPVWMDIDQSDTLQRESARENDDERHICPLQRQVIERCVELWSNPNDVVLSPFGGIASEGYYSLRLGRRYVGIELKQSYFNQGWLNLARAEYEDQNKLL